jgi:hypothetical protein
MSQQLNYKDTSAPAAEPLTLAQAKAQCVLDAGFTLDDSFITDLITEAREHVENLMNRAIFDRTRQLNLDFFPFPDSDSSTVNTINRHCLYGSIWHALAIKLPGPAASAVESITYIDLTGETQTLDPSTYYLDATSEPARIVPKPGLYWPYTQSWLPGSVVITYTAGTYGDGTDVTKCPSPIKRAMKLLISYWYNHRDAAESTPPKDIAEGVDRLLANYSFDSFGF